MAEAHSLEDTMRRHDAAVMNFLRDFRVDYGNLGLGIEDNVDSPFSPIDRNNIPVLAVFASPQRAVAQTIKTLLHSGWIAGNDAGAQAATAAQLEDKAREDFAVLPLPLVTVFRDDPLPNPRDASVPKIFRRQDFDPSALQWESHQWPGAYETRYSLTFWCVKRYTSTFFREWIQTQLGQVGRNNDETLIQVEHNEPWGVIEQRFISEGFTDASELESGDNARIIRVEYPFRLVTWHFRKPVATVDFINNTVISIEEIAPGTDPADVGLPEPALSGNMFSFYIPDHLIPSQWPTAGDATVQRGLVPPPQRNQVRAEFATLYESLRVGVTAVTDEVLVSNRVAALDGDGRAILTLNLKFQGDEDVQLITAVKPPPAEAGTAFETVDSRTLPAATTWTETQFFMLLDQAIFSTVVQGRGTAADFYVGDIILKQVTPGTKVSATTVTPGGGDTDYLFTGLSGNYIAVIAFAGGATSGTITVQGETYAIDTSLSHQIGLVAPLTADSSGEALLLVPDTLAQAEVYLQEYSGLWRGSEI